jgi:signal transduction histidine kinase
MTPTAPDPDEVEREARARDRAQFMATVSHDLKTPLNAVVGFTSVLLLDLHGTEAGRKLVLIHDSARQMLERLNSLVELFRWEAGVLSPGRDWFYPGELLVRVGEEARAAAEERGLAVLVEPRGAPARARSDLRLVHRVLREFLANAIKHSRTGPIRLRALADPPDPQGVRRLRLEVADQGLGLKPDGLAALRTAFDPRVPPAAWSFQDLGLGLALCRQAAHLLGGSLEVDASCEQGARFSLVLALAAGELED